MKNVIIRTEKLSKSFSNKGTAKTPDSTENVQTSAARARDAKNWPTR